MNIGKNIANWIFNRRLSGSDSAQPAARRQNILDKSSPGYQFAVKAFNKAGIDFAALAQTADEDAVVGLLATPATAEAAFAREAELSTLKADLEKTKGELAVAASTGKSILAGLAAAGVRFEENATITAASVEQAVRARSSIMACDQLARHGLRGPLPLAPRSDPTDSLSRDAIASLSGLAKVKAAFRAESERTMQT